MLRYSNLKLCLSLTFLIGVLLFVSCEKGNEGNPFDNWNPDEKKPTSFPVLFSAGLSDWTVSRAANGSWNEGDRVGIYMIPHVAEASDAVNLSVAYTGAVNVPYLTFSSGESVALSALSENDAILYPADGSRVNFVAYSPYRAETHTTNANVYKVDVSNQSPSNHIDLLYYKGVGTAYDKNSKDAKLALTHQLSKMKISLVPASGVAANLTGAALTLTGFPATADFNLSTGVLSGLGGTIKSITPVKDAAFSSSRAAFEAIVVPHTGTSYTRNVTFRLNNNNYSYPLPASATFKAGVAHSYNFRFTGVKVEPAQELVSYGDGGTVSWGDYQLTVGKFSFDLAAIRTTGNTVTLSTNAPSALIYTLSNDADNNTGVPNWITGVSLSNPTPGQDGWKSYTLTFDTDYNINNDAVSRTGYIRLEVAGITLPIRVTQVANALYVNEPNPASFLDLAVGGKTSNTFTLTTNIQDEDITVIAPNTSWITNLTKLRSTVATDGSSTWTISFDVPANTTTDARSGSIEVTIGGIKKTIPVSQAGIHVDEPNPASFPDLAVGGKTGNTFTLATNAPDEDITATTNSSWITNLTKSRSAVATDGSSTWTIGFDVSANTTTDARSGAIEVTIGGQKKTVNVSQVAMFVNAPVPASFANLAAGGVTGKTFTITTNSTATVPTSLTTTDSSMITNLNAVRSVQDATNGIYLWTITFDVMANTNSSPRSATISINIDGNEKIVTVSQIDSTWSPPTYTEDGLANCYMVAPGGGVSIPITRAITIGQLPASANATVEILWKDANVISGNPTLSDSGDPRTIEVTASSTQGNAVIALKVGSTIYWSWHIWVTDCDPKATWTNPNNTNYVFMDRNLGATKAELSLKGRGLFYQWGRKDPFPGGKEGTAGYSALRSFTGINGTAITVSSSSTADGILESIRKPTTFFSYNYSSSYDWLKSRDNTLWCTSTGKKTVYDPCPTGWQVPTSGSDTSSPWCGLSAQPYTSGDTSGVNWGTNAIYTAAGYRSLNGGGYQSTYGYYWTATVQASEAWTMYLGGFNGIDPSYSIERAYGLSVRCVREE